MTDLATGIVELAEEMANIKLAQGFLPGQATVSVVRRMLTLAKLAQAVEHDLAKARKSNLTLIAALLSADADAAAIIALAKSVIADLHSEAGGNVIPFRSRPQPDTSYPTGPDAA